jgi:nucleoid DNA-binding protein
MAIWSRSQKSSGGEILSGMRGLIRGLRGREAEADAAAAAEAQDAAPADRTGRAGDLAAWQAEAVPEAASAWPEGGAAALWPDKPAAAPQPGREPPPQPGPTPEPLAEAAPGTEPSAPQPQRAVKPGPKPARVARRKRARDTRGDKTRPDEVEAPREAAPPSAGAEVDMARRDDAETGAEAAETEAGAGAGGRAQGPVLRKKGFVDAVTAASGQKKSVVRPVVEAVLAELGAALARGEALILPPLGKMIVARTRDRGAADVLTLKLRRGKPGAAAEPGAEAEAEDGEPREAAE